MKMQNKNFNREFSENQSCWNQYSEDQPNVFKSPIHSPELWNIRYAQSSSQQSVQLLPMEIKLGEKDQVSTEQGQFIIDKSDNKKPQFNFLFPQQEVSHLQEQKNQSNKYKISQYLFNQLFISENGVVQLYNKKNKISFIKSIIRLLLSCVKSKLNLKTAEYDEKWRKYIGKIIRKYKRNQLLLNLQTLQQLLCGIGNNHILSETNRKILHQALLNNQIVAKNFLSSKYIRKDNLKKYLICAKVFSHRCKLSTLCKRAQI